MITNHHHHHLSTNMTNSIPTFDHPNNALKTFVNMLLDAAQPSTFYLQLLLICGIKLNNMELVTYAIETQPSLANAPVPHSVMKTIAPFFPDSTSP